LRSGRRAPRAFPGQVEQVQPLVVSAFLDAAARACFDDLRRRHFPPERQDAGKRDLHVTVQNKVTPQEARTLHGALSAADLPRTGTTMGLALWRYLGGPWEEPGRWMFDG
jgi:hypothetical protein